jgi:DNA-binding transcriptional regulator YdaS (Cro superfamily)
MKPIDLVVDMIGSQQAVATLRGVTRPCVSNWVKTGRVPCEPVNHVLELCRAVGWRVTPHQLRPDIYPNAGDAMPGDARKRST